MSARGQGRPTVQDDLEAAIADAGYSWKKFATLEVGISYDRNGRPVDIPNKALLPALTKQINNGRGDDSVLGKYTQMGVAGKRKFLALVIKDAHLITSH